MSIRTVWIRCVCVCACVRVCVCVWVCIMCQIFVSSSQVSLVVSTVDRRKQPLVFKASIYELGQDLLLIEFRRSKVSSTACWGMLYCNCAISSVTGTCICQGDGIEFKKIFKKVKEKCLDLVCKPPPIQ